MKIHHEMLSKYTWILPALLSANLEIYLDYRVKLTSQNS